MKKLLLVDDDISLLKQLSFALANDYDVIEAQNREEALAIIDNERIDIALVDLGMPPFENTHREGRIIINKLLEESGAKVLVLTGQESKEYSQELIKTGVFDYLFKPIEMPTLLEALRRASFFIDNEQNEDENQIQLSFATSLKEGLKGSSDEAQKQLLLKVLYKTRFNINQTARILGISRENCYYFLKKFDIRRPDV